MADAYLVKKSDGSYRLCLMPAGGREETERTGWIGALAEASGHTGDQLLGLVELQNVADVWIEMKDEIVSTREWQQRRDRDALREHLHRVAERWRARNTGRGI